MGVEGFEYDNEQRRKYQIQGKTPPKTRTAVINRAWLAGLAVVSVGMRLPMSKVATTVLPVVKGILSLEA